MEYVPSPEKTFSVSLLNVVFRFIRTPVPHTPQNLLPLLPDKLVLDPLHFSAPTPQVPASLCRDSFSLNCYHSEGCNKMVTGANASCLAWLDTLNRRNWLCCCCRLPPLAPASLPHSPTASDWPCGLGCPPPSVSNKTLQWSVPGQWRGCTHSCTRPGHSS